MASKLDPHLEQVKNLAQSGSTKKYVGLCFNVDEATVRRFAKRHGIAFNNTSGPDALSHEVEDDHEIPVIFRDYSHLDGLYLYPLGDVHVGAAKHQTERWREWVDYLVKTPHTAMLGTGDFINAAIVGAKSDVYEERLTVGEAKRQVREDLRPLAEQGRLDALMPGNHEDRIWRAVGDCPILDICEHLKVNYVRDAAMVVYRVGEVEYELYVRHGTGNGQAMSTLRKSNQVAEADVYVTGHTHQQQVTADNIFVRRGDKLERRARYYVSAGCFLGAEGYSVQRGYAPSRIGAPRIWLNGTRRDVHVSI